MSEAQNQAFSDRKKIPGFKKLKKMEVCNYIFFHTPLEEDLALTFACQCIPHEKSK